MEQDQQASRAEQRMLAVAKLKRAASLPRMKDGRRPPMHVEAVSEGEKSQIDGDKDVDTPPPEVSLVEPVEVEADVEVDEGAISSVPAARTKRRSRSRSRSRGSKDLKGKSRALQSPTPTPMVNGDSSQDEGPPPSLIALEVMTPPLLSPIPSHFAELPRSRLLRSPTPTSPESSLFYPGTSPPTPLLPTLEALQKGLFRSNSASGSNARMMAMHKLTGGTETYDPSSSPTPPPLLGKLSRNNTVSGGERSAARQLMLSRLGGRITKETDGEQASGGEERLAPSPTPKKRRRRSRRSSTTVVTGVSDSEFLSTSPNTPAVPQTPLPTTFDNLVDEARSATPNQVASSPMEQALVEVEQPGPTTTRRRSVVNEDEEERRYRLPPVHPGLPSTPPQSIPHIAAPQALHTSDTPSSTSTDSASQPAVGVPVYLGQHTPSKNSSFPSSPQTPLKETSSRDDDEEQVLYPADTFRSRTPYEDTYGREISWVASPLPEIRMPIDDDEDEDEDGDEPEQEEREGPDYEERSFNRFSPPENEGYNDTSSRISLDSKNLVVESETSPNFAPSYFPLSPSVAALSQTASIAPASDDSMSPQTYPARLSVASRSPLNGESTDWDDRPLNTELSTKRSGDQPSTWEKVTSMFTRTNSTSGRRSRTNSFATRDRRDHTDSSVSRESGASLTSAKTDKGEVIGTFSHQQTQPSLMQSPSASASILSLAPARGGPSPIPPTSPGDLSKYQNAKLFPFPGMKKLEEQRNRAKGLPSASASTPDVTMLSSSNDEDQPPLSASSYTHTPVHTPEMTRVRKLSHQASDTRLIAKYTPNSPTPTPSSSRLDNLNATLTQNGGSLNLKLPMTLPGVKQWLSKNNKKKVPAQASSPSSVPTSAPTSDSRSPNTNKKPSLSDLLRRKDSELGTDWEDIGTTPTSTSGDTLLGKGTSPSEPKELFDAPLANGSATARSDHTDTEKTPKVKKVMPPAIIHSEFEATYLQFDDSPPSAPPSRPDPPSSTTPDPSSSLSDYPAHSTSESSSTTSSQYSLGHLGPHGSMMLERLEEHLARGSRSPLWASAIDNPVRKLMLSSPVLQVVNPNTVKDRFLFLFSDILVIAKPVIQDHEDSLDRKFIVKSVVLLHQLRFCADRTEPQPKTSSYAMAPRNPLIRIFVSNFAKDPDHAISSLISKSGITDDPVVLGQLLLKTVDLDRVRLGEYLSKRGSKSVLKAYLDNFGFIGLRLDRALRVFLQSIHVPARSSHSNTGLEYLLDTFASRWYEANARIVDYDKDLAIRLVRALVQLNDLLHDGIAQEPGPIGDLRRDITSEVFLDAFRRYDIRYLVSDELLEELYKSIRQERLSQARISASNAEAEIHISLKRSLPARLTYKIQSEPVVLRIPQIDPQLTIQLYGQDLVFDPPVLTFSKSSEASFRVMGTSLGPKSLIMCRSGPNALRYTGLPFSNTLVVERAFMRNTFQLAFLNHNRIKRRYMFSVDDSLVRHQWVVSLKQQIDNATASVAVPLGSLPPVAAKFYRAAEKMAFKILQENLIGAPAISIQRALHRLSDPPHNGNNGTSRLASDQLGGLGANSNTFQLSSPHLRSKSRSKVYHRHGAGKNEWDLLLDELNGRDSREGGDESEVTSQQDQLIHPEGPLWSDLDLEMQCQQNSSIALVLSYLHVWAPEHGPNVGS